MTTQLEAVAIRSFDVSLPMALLRARESAMRLFRPMLAEHDLTEQQWRVLRALASAEESPEVGELAEATFLLSPSLSRILANLEGRGLVERAPVVEDGRRSTIALTRAGHDLVSDVAPHSERIYAEIEAAFGQRDLHDLIDRLDALRRALPDDTEVPR